MSILNTNYRVSIGQYGLRVIEVTGRCTRIERSDVEADCCRRFDLVPLPNSNGAILKSLDGSTPRMVRIRPDTFSGDQYKCVKIEGLVNPMAPAQSGGSHTGQIILSYYIKYQEVGAIA